VEIVAKVIDIDVNFI